MSRVSVDVVRAVATEGFVSHAELVRAGLNRHQIRRALRRLHAVRLARGLYRLPNVECSDEEVRSLVARERGVLSHLSAAVWWGFDVVVDPARPQVTVGRHRSRAGASVMRRELTPDDVTRCRGLRITTPMRTVLDCARTLPLAEAVVVADSALRLRAITMEELRAAANLVTFGPAAGKARAALALADDACGSVLESLLRVLLASNGLAPPCSQHVIRDRTGRRVKRVDFAWPDHRLIVEADGFEFHSTRASYRDDRRCGNAYTRAGWRFLRFSWEDVVDHPEEVLAAVRDCLALAA